MLYKLRYLVLLSIFIQGCVSASASSLTPTASPVPPIPTATLTPIQPSVPDEATATPVLIPPQPISRVFIVTFDGLRPDAIEAAEMDNVKALMQTGAYTMKAQTIIPSITLPAHASLVTGTCPAKHIARWNEYVPQNGYALGTDIFDLTHAVGLRTALVVGKEKLRHITEPGSTDFFGFVDNTDEEFDETTIESMTIEQIRAGFGLLMVHFPDGDVAGHQYDWMSKQQLSAFHKKDESLGLFLRVMKDSGFYDGTLIIVTSDHGGHNSDHGLNIPEDMTIPWVVSGPQIVPGELQTQVYIYDTAPTVAFALGLPIQADWDGVPVYEAFGLPVDPLRQGGCPGVTPR
ncbi:MAG: alkaline phosphatase family protein [Anaerolineales bacterium]|nr:alkaline phosphatase family protein [Anaerolineales bacterium]GJQ34502.1 MAG: phosphodiesterase [Anaerolineaceae bacterium]